MGTVMVIGTGFAIATGTGRGTGRGIGTGIATDTGAGVEATVDRVRTLAAGDMVEAIMDEDRSRRTVRLEELTRDRVPKAIIEVDAGIGDRRAQSLRQLLVLLATGSHWNLSILLLIRTPHVHSPHGRCDPINLQSKVLSINT